MLTRPLKKLVVLATVGAAVWLLTGGTAKASYQLTQTYNDPSSGNNDNFGYSAALNGNNSVLIGAYGVGGGQGAAYLYNTSGTPLHTFKDPSSGHGDNFGFSVALNGNNVLIGAPGVRGGQGAAYLYNTSGTLLGTYSDPNSSNRDYFGVSVALNGNNVLIGGTGVPGGNYQGAAYLYNTSGTLLGTYSDPSSGNGDIFGSSVALNGNNVLIGAYGVPDGNAQGAAYLYNTSGTLLKTFKEPSSGYNYNDQFGESVALNGNNVLIGAPGVPSGNYQGAAYLYNTSGTLLKTFNDPSSGNGDNFGVYVALNGNNVLIGAAGVPGGNNQGAAYLYNTSGTLLQPFNDTSSGYNDLFGNFVALNGNNVLIGANGVPGGNNQGAAYLYQQQSPESVPEPSNLMAVDLLLGLRLTFGYLKRSQESEGRR